jgi:hypothetical protein
VSLVYSITHHTDVAESVYITEVIYREGGEATEAVQPRNKKNPLRWKGFIEKIGSIELRCEGMAQSGQESSDLCCGGP